MVERGDLHLFKQSKERPPHSVATWPSLVDGFGRLVGGVLAGAAVRGWIHPQRAALSTRKQQQLSVRHGP
eukprot:scaffold306_cov525-Prasinococcus_capsulatus_cf.AAC.12